MPHTAKWFTLVLPILGCFGGGSLYGWSGYMPAVRDAFDVSNASASMVFSIALASFTLGVLLGPAISSRIPARVRLSTIAAIATACIGLSGASVGFALFVFFYGAGFGFASGALYNHAISQSAASRRAEVFVPVSVAAFGLGGAVFGPINVWLTAHGWGLWSMSPALICLAGVALAGMIAKPAATTGSEGIAENANHARPDRTIALMWLIFAAGSCSGLIVLGFASQILQRGSDAVGLASAAIFLAALGNTLGRLSATLIAGRFGPAPGIAGSLLLSIIALAGIIATVSPAKLLFLLFIVAFAYGHLAANTPLLVRAKVSQAAFSGSFGWVFTGWGFAGLLGPWTAGWVLDTKGDLRIALIVCICLAAAGLFLLAHLHRSDRARGSS